MVTDNAVYIVGTARTPIGSLLGQLSSQNYVDLGAHAVKAAISRSGIQPSEVEEIIFGNVYGANVGQAPARQVALKAGLSEHVIATTVNKVCASGMKAIMLGSQVIMTGGADVVVAGGAESMSNVPHYVPSLRSGCKFGGSSIVDGLEKDGLQDAYSHEAMGLAGEDTAAEHGFTREQQDAFAVESYQRAQRAAEAGKFTEIAPVEVPNRRGPPTTVDRDEEPARLDENRLRSARTVFKKDGSLTAPNSSPINDGGAAVILVSGRKLKQLSGVSPLAQIVSFADAAQAPIKFPQSPALAAEKALKRAGLTKSDIDFFEFNEAFSVVGLCNTAAMQLDPARVNPYGGAVALGHPLGCSGARIVTTLLSVLAQENGSYGLAAICNGGGGASALIVKRILGHSSL